MTKTRSETTVESQDPWRTRRAKLQALLFTGAAIGAAVLMFARGPKEPIGAGE